MKDFIKFVSKITGLFRSIVTILFLLGIVFTALVDASLLTAFVDMLGFIGISEAIIKPIFFVIFGLMFIINFIITRHIFRAGETGEYHVSNLVFALLFLAIDAFIYMTLRNLNSPLIYVFFALNGLIILNSILGLIARARGEYIIEETIVAEPEEVEYIEIETEEEPEEVVVLSPKPESKEKVIKETTISATGEVATKPEIEKEIQKQEQADRTTLEKDQKMVFESGSHKADSKPEQKTNETNKETTTIKRVAKKKEKPATEKFKVVDATNKVSRGSAVSTEEIYESKNTDDKAE